MYRYKPNCMSYICEVIYEINSIRDLPTPTFHVFILIRHKLLTKSNIV